METAHQPSTSDALSATHTGLVPPGLSPAHGGLNSSQYLLNAVSDGVLALNLDLSIDYANSTACRLLGCTRNDLSGHPFSEFIADTLSTDVATNQLYDPVLSTGELIATDTARMRRKDGSLFQVMLTAIPVTADDSLAGQIPARPGARSESAATQTKTNRDPGAIQGLLLVFRDVTPGLYLSLRKINQLLTRLMAQQGARSTIEAALGGVAEILDADFAVLGAYEREDDTILFDAYYECLNAERKTATATADNSGDMTSLRIPAADTPYGYIYHNRNPVYINDYPGHPLAHAEFLKRGAACLLATPVVEESRLRGVAYFFRTSTRPFHDSDLENIRTLGPVLAAAFFKADHESRMTELATTDPLTGLLNRRMIFEKIREETERARRYRTECSALMLDLDLFKEINDAYGHLAGDRVLREVARVLGSNTRSADSVARTGGEEFLILLPQTGIDGAMRTAEKIRDRIQQLRIEAVHAADGSANTGEIANPKVERISVTVSIGCASYEPGESTDAFYARLDQLLYKSKFAGRNRITR